MAGRFFALLWGDLQISLLLRLVEAPHPDEIEERAGSAVGALLSLYALPNKATPAANFGTARRDGDHS
jgi:hypothetical protein